MTTVEATAADTTETRDITAAQEAARRIHQALGADFPSLFAKLYRINLDNGGEPGVRVTVAECMVEADCSLNALKEDAWPALQDPTGDNLRRASRLWNACHIDKASLGVPDVVLPGRGRLQRSTKLIRQLRQRLRKAIAVCAEYPGANVMVSYCDHIRERDDPGVEFCSFVGSVLIDIGRCLEFALLEFLHQPMHVIGVVKGSERAALAASLDAYRPAPEQAPELPSTDELARCPSR